MPDISTTPANRVKALAANSTATSFAALTELILATTPSGFNMAGKNSVLIWPFGTDAANETFNIKVVLWWPGNKSWGYSEGFVGSCILGADAGPANGIAGGDVIDSDIYCDIITYTAGVAPYSIQGTTAETPALLRVDTLGAHYVQFDFDRVTSADCNAMVARI